jgi:tRNA modification GTPase
VAVSGYELSHTIVAVSTPPGRGALAIVRLSGSRAWDIALRLLPSPPPRVTPRRAYPQRIRIPLPSPAPVIEDTGVITFWGAGASYTGDAMAEISLHGNPLLVSHCVAACLTAGARQALPGEFSLRACLTGKLDLAQAQAVQDIINATSTRALQLSTAAGIGVLGAQLRDWTQRMKQMLAAIEVIHDYGADDLDATLDPATTMHPARLIAELNALSLELEAAVQASRQAAPLRGGVTVAICGQPNVGKSTLFNALLGYERALTAPEPGTTRDFLSESLESEGLRLTLVDTAGYRTAADALEAAGVRRSGDWARSADRVLWVSAADLPAGAIPLELQLQNPLHVVTRCDLLPVWPALAPDCIHVSGVTGQGLAAVWVALRGVAQALDAPATLAAFNERQSAGLAEAATLLRQAQLACVTMPLDAVAADIYSARNHLRQLYEHPDRAEVVADIFSTFCVGK